MNRLKELRESLHISVEEFCKMFEVHRSSVYRYEGTNKNEPRELPIGLALRVAEKFNVSMDWLVGKDVPKYRDNISSMLTEIYDRLSDEGRKELINFAVYLRTKEEQA